jgi:RHH-type rel operon transcriptional repressor/antitoxin RelB
MTTTIRLDRTLEKRLDRLVKRTGRTKAYFLREMIESRLEDLEDYYLALTTMENVRSGEENVHSAKDVRKEVVQ